MLINSRYKIPIMHYVPMIRRYLLSDKNGLPYFIFYAILVYVSICIRILLVGLICLGFVKTGMHCAACFV